MGIESSLNGSPAVPTQQGLTDTYPSTPTDVARFTDCDVELDLELANYYEGPGFNLTFGDSPTTDYLNLPTSGTPPIGCGTACTPKWSCVTTYVGEIDDPGFDLEYYKTYAVEYGIYFNYEGQLNEDQVRCGQTNYYDYKFATDVEKVKLMVRIGKTDIGVTSLSTDIDSSQTTITVASAFSFPTEGDFRIFVGDETMLVTAVSGTTFTVTRGIDGTTATSHDSGKSVKHKGRVGILISGNFVPKRYTYPDTVSTGFVNCPNINNPVKLERGEWRERPTTTPSTPVNNDKPWCGLACCTCVNYDNPDPGDFPDHYPYWYTWDNCFNPALGFDPYPGWRPLGMSGYPCNPYISPTGSIYYAPPSLVFANFWGMFWGFEEFDVADFDWCHDSFEITVGATSGASCGYGTGNTITITASCPEDE